TGTCTSSTPRAWKNSRTVRSTAPRTARASREQEGRQSSTIRAAGPSAFRAAHVFAGAGVDAQLVADLDEQRHLDHGARGQRCRLAAALGGIAADPRIGLDDLELEEIRRGDRDRLVVPERDLVDLLLLQPVLRRSEERRVGICCRKPCPPARLSG